MGGPGSSRGGVMAMIHDGDEAAAARRRPERLGHSRVGALWAGMILAALVLVLLLVFVGQNSQTVTVRFLWATGRLPLGVAMLFAAIAGVLAVAVPGTIRIVQLRRLAAGRRDGRGVRRHAHHRDDDSG